MTVALGMLAGTGIVIAADTEGTFGEHKVATLKTKAAFPSNGKSALAITGAGDTWYIETLTQRLEDLHAANDSASHAELGKLFQEELEDFYARHVIPFADRELEIQLIIGLQRDGLNSLWATAKNTMRQLYSHEVVGEGDVQAKSVIDSALIVEDVAQGVLVACCAVYQAKQKVKGCGQSTTVECLHGNYAHHIFPDVIESVEKWFAKHTNLTGNAFIYSLGYRNLDEDGHLEKLGGWFRESRKEAAAIMNRIVQDLDHSTPSVSQTSAGQQ